MLALKVIRLVMVFVSFCSGVRAEDGQREISTSNQIALKDLHLYKILSYQQVFIKTSLSAIESDPNRDLAHYNDLIAVSKRSAEALRLMEEIVQGLNAGDCFKRPEIKNNFLAACNKLDSNESLQLCDIRELAQIINRLIDFVMSYGFKLHLGGLSEQERILINKIVYWGQIVSRGLLREELFDFGATDYFVDYCWDLPLEFIDNHKGLILATGAVAAAVWYYLQTRNNHPLVLPLPPPLPNQEITQKKSTLTSDQLPEPDVFGLTNYRYYYNKKGQREINPKTTANACYMNSSTQCLMRLPFNNALPPRADLKDPVLEAYANLRSNERSYLDEKQMQSYVDASAFQEVVHNSWDVTMALDHPFQQLDAPEFVEFLFGRLKAVQTKDRKQAALLKPFQIDCLKESDHTVCTDCLPKNPEKDAKIADPNSRDLLRLRLKNANDDNFQTLQDCIRDFFQGHAGDQVHCISCTKLFVPQEYFRLTAYPEVLTIQLQRFDEKKACMKDVKRIDPKTKEEKIAKRYVMPKIETAIPIPLQLDLKTCCGANPPAEEKIAYELSGVVLHAGEWDYGHYTAYIKNKDGFWHYCNDRLVEKRDIKPVADNGVDKVSIYGVPTPYLLFYVKRPVETLSLHKPQEKVQTVALM